MKKIFCFVILSIFLSFSVRAQMTDALGALAIGGAMGMGDIQMISKGQGAMNNLRFQEDLTRLMTDAQLYGAGQNTSFDGFRGLDWKISSEGYETVLEFNHLNAALVLIGKQNEAAVNRIEINGGSVCGAEDNHVKIYF